MELLIPLAIFLILCVVMIVVLSKTEPPTSIDNVESLCDAVIRNDLYTQSTLISFQEIPREVVSTLKKVSEFHKETAKQYNSQKVKSWVDENASYEVIEVKIDEKLFLSFECRYAANQWTIAKVEIVDLASTK